MASCWFVFFTVVVWDVLICVSCCSTFGACMAALRVVADTDWRLTGNGSKLAQARLDSVVGRCSGVAVYKSDDDGSSPIAGPYKKSVFCISPHAGSNHGPFAYEASALPLSYRGICWPYHTVIWPNHNISPKLEADIFAILTTRMYRYAVHKHANQDTSLHACTQTNRYIVIGCETSFGKRRKCLQ